MLTVSSSVPNSSQFRYLDSEVVVEVTTSGGSKLKGLVQPEVLNSYIVEGNDVDQSGPLGINLNGDDGAVIGAAVITMRAPGTELSKKFDFVLGLDFCGEFGWVIAPSEGYVQPLNKSGFAEAIVQYSKKMRSPFTFPLKQLKSGQKIEFTFSARKPEVAKLVSAYSLFGQNFPVIVDKNDKFYYAIGSICSQRFLIDFQAEEVTIETSPLSVAERLLASFPNLNMSKTEVESLVTLGKYNSIKLN